MDRLLKHKLSYQVIAVVLLIVSVQLYFLTKGYEEYVYDDLGWKLQSTFQEIGDLNKILVEMYTFSDYELGENVRLDKSYSMTWTHIKIRDVMNLRGDHFSWWYFVGIESVLNDIAEKEFLSEEDIEYLKGTYTINLKLMNIYDDILRKHDVYDHYRINEPEKVKAIYEAFLIEAELVMKDPSNEAIIDYEIEFESTLDQSDPRDISLLTLDREEVEKKIKEIHKKLFAKEMGLVSEDAMRPNELTYLSEWTEEGVEKAYRSSIDLKDGSIEIALKSLSFSSISQPELLVAELDVKPLEILDKLNLDDYVPFGKEIYSEGDDIHMVSYSFVRVLDDCYDLKSRVSISIDSEGVISDIKIGNPFNYEIAGVLTPVMNSEKILSNLEGKDLLQTILVKSEDGKHQYWVYFEEHDEKYVVIYDAYDGARLDFRKYEARVDYPL